MEYTFSLKPQACSLIARAPPPSPLYARPMALLRREFVGCGHNLRLPRRRSRKARQKFQSNYSKSLSRASLESQPIVFFFASVSAMTVVYFTNSRKQFNVMRISGRLTLALLKQIISIASWILTDSGLVDSRKKVSTDGRKDSMKETKDNNQANRDMGAEITFTETNMIPGGIFMAEASQKLNMVASGFHHNLASHTSDDLEMSPVSSVLSAHTVLPLVKEVCEVHLDATEHPNSLGSELSVPVVQTNLNAAPSESHLHEEADSLCKLKLEFLEESDVNQCNIIFRESPRRELHTINGASLEMLDNMEPLSSCATLQKNSSSSSLIDTPLADGSNVNSYNVIFPIGKLGEDGQEDSRGRRQLRKKDKNVYHLDRSKTLHLSSRSSEKHNKTVSHDPKEKHNNDKHNPLWQLRVYNQLIREGRLNDCLELLEDLEEKGLLDMDKVYHARFFEVCKSQKAVKEAFRFTRLIPNPTLSTFNMLMSVCARSPDSEGAFQVLQHVQEAGLKADCKLYTTLISTCAKSGKVDTMFKVFHEMVNAGVEPNVHTYSALIDGCAKAGQIAKAFGAYGILRSKNVKPDRAVFNALITACGQSGAVDRAFDVLAEMRSELQPIDPDHITIGALMKACARAGQIDRAREVYNMIHEYNICGTAELYTIAVNSCSDWEFACSVYDDMIKKSIPPDEMFISALIDVAGHAGKVDAAFEILQEAGSKGMHVGIISYSSLMGACSNAKDWQKALKLYEDIKSLNLTPSVAMMNALITALCEADQLPKAMETLLEMKHMGLCPNTITYSLLIVASEKKDDLEAGIMLFTQAKKDAVTPNLVICRCLVAMCLRRFQTASTVGEPVLSFTSGGVQLNSKWTSLALMVYRETITAGVTPTMDELSQVLGCLKIPHDDSVRSRLVENLGVNTNRSKGANLHSLIDGFGEYDPRAFSLVEEAAFLGVIPLVSMNESPIVVDVRIFHVHTAEVYLLTVLKGLKHRLAAGAKLPNVIILLPIEETQVQTSSGEKVFNIAGRISQYIAAQLRRLGLPYQGNESYGKIRINGVNIKKWFQPKLRSPFSERTRDLNSSVRHLGSGISRQQRKIRTGHLSLD